MEFEDWYILYKEYLEGMNVAVPNKAFCREIYDKHRQAEIDKTD